jgi:hypothetical protein
MASSATAVRMLQPLLLLPLVAVVQPIEQQDTTNTISYFCMSAQALTPTQLLEEWLLVVFESVTLAGTQRWRSAARINSIPRPQTT